MPRLSKFLLALLAATLLLAACGDDDDVISEDPALPEIDEPEPDLPEADLPDPDIDDPEVDDPEIDDPMDDDPVINDRGDDFAEDAYLLFNGAGIETDQGLVAFGDPETDALATLRTYLGEPTSDSGTQPVGQDCLANGETFRRVLHGDTEIIIVDGTFQWWFTTDPDQNTEAFVGDQTRVSIIAGHTTVGELKEALGDAVEVADEPPLGPSYTVTDNFGTLSGEVSDLSDDGVVQGVFSGIGCGE